MTAEELREKLMDHQDDYEFDYRGKSGAICIFDDEIIAGYDGTEESYGSIEEVMTARFINGKSLSEVAEEIKIYG